uniref:uracil phosphoribosyltransferase n=1 Tax=Phaeocystis antarctica TaxID=33657 RepID=A0A7S0HKD2_9EUKA|mmetsp:Transcript_21970/g.52079  ORF Transcript_21970/g.52079 Transcript_21970/m.52079 type:complete len:244 (+) Transcript_21970:69-800(+)
MSKRKAQVIEEGTGSGLVRHSTHPLIKHKVTQMRKADASAKYLKQLMHEISTLLCFEATADLPLQPCAVRTKDGNEEDGTRVSERVGVVPVLRGGLGMVEAMTEMVAGAQVWHLGIYRDKASLLPVEYYNKLPKKVTVHTVYVLDPMPVSGATAVAAVDILKAWGAGLPHGKTLTIKFICIGASEQAVAKFTEAHPDVPFHVGLIDVLQDDKGKPLRPVLPSMGDIGDRMFGTDPDTPPLCEE